jgi:hypothetical protein
MEIIIGVSVPTTMWVIYWWVTDHFADYKIMKDTLLFRHPVDITCSVGMWAFHIVSFISIMIIISW